MLLAGSGDDLATSVALGEAGDLYITGNVTFDTFPPTSGAYQDASPGLFVSRFRPDGSVGFTAALGGQRGEAIALDASGNVYVAGIDASGAQAFIAKLSADGATLLYRRNLGPVDNRAHSYGAAVPARLALSVDAAGNAYVGGTAVAGFVATPGAFDETLGGRTDGFISVVDAQGAIASSTFLGGAGADGIVSLVVDDTTGAVVVTGPADSADFPVTPNTLAPPSAFGSSFVASLTGNALNFSSLLGHEAQVRKITRGQTGPSGPAPGSVWITGTTASQTFPVTPGAYGTFATTSYFPRQLTFVMQLSSAGDLLYSSSLLPGGYTGTSDGSDREPGSDRALSVAVVDVAGHAKKIYVAGESNRNRSYFSGEDDGFGFVIDLMTNTGRYTDALGGQADEAFVDVAVNRRGDLAFLGFTTSYYTAYEFQFGGPDTIMHGALVDRDEEMNGWMPFDIVVFKRVAPANTALGTNVIVTGPTPGLTVTFSSVTGPGDTSITQIADPSALNLTLPGGFAISGTSGAYEITSTATFAGTIEVCLVAGAMSDADFANASILHGVGGAWQVETTRRDLATRRLCADVTSLSPFAVGVLSDSTAPQITCEPVPTTWQASNVTVQCSASDSGGFASAGDASFSLSTSVAAGSETAAAVTDSRIVCDRAGNCATAGPIGGIRIDMRPPAVQIASPSARRYLLAETASASFACTDAGSGIASCEGPVASGSAIDTTEVGARSFTVTAGDHAGNTASAAVAYTVGYGIQSLYDDQRAYKRGSAVSLTVALVDATGRNVSSAGVTLVARRLTRLADGWTMPLAITLPYLQKSASYGGKVDTSGLQPGTYEVELEASGDPGVLRIRFTLK